MNAAPYNGLTDPFDGLHYSALHAPPSPLLDPATGSATAHGNTAPATTGPPPAFTRINPQDRVHLVTRSCAPVHSVVLITTSPLPPMSQLLARFLPEHPPHTDGGANSGGGAPAPAAPLLTFGSRGPLRMCAPEMQAQLGYRNLPAAAWSGPPPHEVLEDASAPTELETEDAAWDLTSLVHAICGQAAAAAAAYAVGGATDGSGAGSGSQGTTKSAVRGVLVAVRLGADTPADEYSVLVGLRGSCTQRMNEAVGVIAQEMGQLLCA